MQAFFQRVSTIKRAARGRTGNNAARRVADTEQCSAPRGRHKTKKHFAGRAKKVERRSAVPPVFFHIPAAVLAKSHAFRFEKPPLLMPARCGVGGGILDERLGERLHGLVKGRHARPRAAQLLRAQQHSTARRLARAYIAAFSRPSRSISPA